MLKVVFGPKQLLSADIKANQALLISIKKAPIKDNYFFRINFSIMKGQLKPAYYINTAKERF